MLHEGRFSTDKPSCTATCTENYKVITDTNLYCQLCGVNNKIVAQSKRGNQKCREKKVYMTMTAKKVIMRKNIEFYVLWLI